MLVDNVKTTNYYIYIYTLLYAFRYKLEYTPKSLINLNSKFNIVETINPQVDWFIKLEKLMQL